VRGGKRSFSSFKGYVDRWGAGMPTVIELVDPQANDFDGNVALDTILTSRHTDLPSISVSHRGRLWAATQ